MTQLPKSKVRSIGVSNFAIEHLEAIIKDSGIVPAVNQIERHPRIPNPPLIKYCKEKGIVITAYSAFGNNFFGLPLLVNVPEVKAIAERLSKVQGKTVTPAQVILAWSQLDGHTVIPKSVTPERILENFQEVGLDDQAIRDLDKFGETPQRLNLPGCEWNINIFGDEKESKTTNQIIVNA
ncbi:Short chain dehydrogenase/reductase [Trichoderma simmonsii]|nr:Short chain dehydrogenase/reductase [Trichoderma simmonsii]